VTATNLVATPAERPPLFRPELAERNWEILESRGLLPQPPRHATLVIVVLTVVFTAAGIFIARGGSRASNSPPDTSSRPPASCACALPGRASSAPST
jgi:hypothetical protein